ncbi:ABC1 kinase family protein [Methanobrevibacter millerae]|uniref:Ubiquinone biosynthesis protein n=1 Tax=Methanobrevibacter millerae TaxID=230361 RepID=A0A1G5W258_9EURY|nr:AarF/ABC1/UbiB kinase family protein [Methanobrevibacter millerae]SDA51305.1 ubiquinone biosynthesis protein [Methanobrevibacter millerae]
MKVIPKETNDDIKRINQIYKVLKKNDFGYLIEENTFFKKFPFLRNRKKSDDDKLPDETIPIRIRKVCEDLGPAYIKLGQMLSTRPDLVGVEISEELQKLRDDTPAMDFDEMKKVIESELGSPIDEIYDSFNEMPIGSASIAQVYTAKLKENGKEVAIKVQKPNIEEIIKSDLKLMKFLAVRIDKYLYKTKIYNLPSIVDEFERSILKEINFEEEVRNMEVMAKNFEDVSYIHIPIPYNDYSTKKVITMELIDGIELTRVIKSNCEKYDKKLIAQRGMDSYFKQVMIDGFFHADPHPGNIMVYDDNTICYIDVGMVGILTDDVRGNLAELILLLYNGNTDNIINQLIYMDIISPTQNTPELKADINDLMKKYYGAKLKNANGSIEDLVKAMINNDIVLPREFVMLGRGLTLIEESGRKLNPDFDTGDELKKVAQKLLIYQASPKRAFNVTSNFLLEMGHLAKNLPNTMNSTISKLDDGQLTLNLKLEWLMEVAKQITIAIIIAAVIVGSSIAIFADRGPKLFDISIIGLIGFVFSAALGIYLVIQYLMMEMD